MIELVVDNSICQLRNLPITRLRELRDILFYRDKKKQIAVNLKDKTTGKPIINKVTGKLVKKYINPKVSLIEKNGQFPTGLLYLVEHYLKINKVTHQVIDTRKRPELYQLGSTDSIIKLDGIEPYLEQYEGAEAACEHGRGIEVAPTGVGKSLICALVLDKFQVKSLVVVPSVELKNQLTTSLRKMFGCDLVGPLVDGKYEYFFTVENVDQLNPYKIPERVDCVIIDEFHRSGAETYQKLNKEAWNDVYFKIGVTATPFRSQENERLLLESVLSQVIYCIDYQTAVEKKYIVPMEVYYVDLPVVECNARKYDDAYRELVVERKDRNELIADMIANLHSQGLSTLTLVKRIEHGQRLQELAEARQTIVPFAAGINDDNKELIEAFNAKQDPVMIGTVGVLGEGIDTRPCEYVILAGGGKSKNQFMQNIGRGFRIYPGKTSCKIIMIRDASNKWLLKHFNECVKYLKEEYNIEPVKLNL